MANEDKKYFSENQAYFHGFGRAFTRKGQDIVDQAPMKAGHNLDTYSIRSNVLPFIDEQYIIQEDYFVEGVNLKGQSILSGIEGSRYVRPELSDILKFYDGAELTADPKSNEQTWQLIDNGSAIAGFVDPTDKFSTDGLSSSYGYTMNLLKGLDNSPIPSKEGQTWAFNAFNGAVTFVDGETPQSAWNGIKIRAFAYVGDVLEDRLSTIENNIGLANQSSTSGIEAVQDDVNFISGTILSGFDAETTVSSVIAEVRSNAALFSLSAVEDAGDFAAQYQLMQTINNVTTPVEGSIINIPKDQFLSQAAFGYMTADDGSGEWNDAKDQTYQYPTLKLTFALDVDGNKDNGIQSSVFIPMHDLINDYSAASGVQYDEEHNTFSVKIDEATEDFLTVGADGVRLSGVQEAIDTAIDELSEAATAGLEALSGAASGYLSGNAISGKFTEIDGRLDADENNITSLTNALVGYTASGAVSGEFKKLEDSVDSIHNNNKIVSGTVDSATAVGTISGNKLTVDVQISNIPGNAIVVKTSGETASPSGLWAQAYKSGDGIEFGPADENGIIPISATYELPVATTTEIGGVKAGDYIDVDSTGQVVVKHTVSSLYMFDNNFMFNGSANKTLIAGDYLRATIDGENEALTLEVVAEGVVEAENSGLIKGVQVYEVSSALASAIVKANDDLSGAISGAYTSGMIVIGDTDKIVASPIKLGVDRTFTGETADDDHAQFGQEDNTAATEVTVKSFVNFGLDDLANAISGFNEEVEAIH